MTTDKNGSIPKIVNCIFVAILLYVLQTSIILLFLRYSICDTSLNWEENNIHFTLQQYEDENYEMSNK